MYVGCMYVPAYFGQADIACSVTSAAALSAIQFDLTPPYLQRELAWRCQQRAIDIDGDRT